jgi:hypothetical protein
METTEPKAAPTFEQLVIEKQKAGLDRDQAEQIVKAQLAHNKKISDAAAKAAEDDKSKKTAKA